MNDTRSIVTKVARRRALVLVFGGMALGATACFTVGENFSARPVRRIEKGITTKDEVRKLFGDPFRTGLDDGYESWTYVYNRWSLFSPTRSKDLYIVFNRDGTVRTYTYNSNLDEE